MIKTYYFAHNFNNRKEFRQLELSLEKELGIQLLNPFYDVPERKEEMAELDARNENATGRIKSFKNKFNRDKDDAETIVLRDLKNILFSNGLFTIVDKPSFGTTFEIAFAIFIRKPVYFISEVYIDHPWIKYFVQYRYRTIEEFKNAVIRGEIKK